MALIMLHTNAKENRGLPDFSWGYSLFPYGQYGQF